MRRIPGFDERAREEAICAIFKDFPFVQREVVAESLCSRPIEALWLGEKSGAVLFAGAFHGMEWLTSQIVLRFFSVICEKFKHREKFSKINTESFLKQWGLCVIPCVNPDGVEISLHGAERSGDYEDLVRSCTIDGDTSNWQANARGVDLNHNFDAAWETVHENEQNAGYTLPGPTRYGGCAPESEPETAGLAKFVRENNFRKVLAFHSQGEEIYWHFGENTPPEGKLQANVMAQLSTYRACEPEPLAVGGGFKDWFIEKFSRPGFTLEIGMGTNPLPLGCADKIYKQIEEMLFYSLIS